MSTIIYPSPIFGPIMSRRLGVSLGINLLPEDGKFCTFNCIYCECGFNEDHRPHRPLPTREEVRTALEAKLKEMQCNGPIPNVLTFAGNGEPTAHPDFAGIVDDVVALRNIYFPNAKVSVLSNSTMIHKPDVFTALKKVDNNILKLDTIDSSYISLVDRPLQSDYNVKRVINDMIRFNGHVIIQTMFMKGKFGDEDVNNTSDNYVLPWLNAVRAIGPQQVMVYTIDRETPDHELRKATHEELDNIANRVRALGISCSASY